MHSQDAAHYHYVHRKTVDSAIHGRVSTIPARLTGYGEAWDGNECTLWCEGVVQQSAVFGDVAVEGYEPPAAVKANWGTYHHKQSGDPTKLAEALLALNAMKSPPKQFLAGSDALESVPPALQARIDEMRAHAELSKSTDGKF